MAEITLCGFGPLERARLRYELSQDEGFDYDVDPFTDDPIEIEVGISGFPALVRVLSAIHDALQIPSSSPKKAPRKTPERKLSKATTTRKTVNWKELVGNLESGELDEYQDTRETKNVYAMKAFLLKKYPGLEITTGLVAGEEGMSHITVRAGSRV